MDTPIFPEGFAALPPPNQEIIPPTPYPSHFEMAANLAGSFGGFIINGFKVATEEQLTTRKAICKECPEWNPAGFGGTGSCKKCGCSTQAKLRMANSKCPIDKWGPITTETTETPAV